MFSSLVCALVSSLLIFAGMTHPLSQTQWLILASSHGEGREHNQMHNTSQAFHHAILNNILLTKVNHVGIPS